MKLVLYRKSNNFSQTEVAKQLGLSCKTISAYERGTRKPNFLNLKKLAKLYQTTVDELISDDKDDLL